MQTQKSNCFICTIDGKSFVVETGSNKKTQETTIQELKEEISEDNMSLFAKLAKYAKTPSKREDKFEKFKKISSEGDFSIISPRFSEIEEREDGMFNIYEDGWGLMDSTMQVIIKPQFAYRLDNYSKYMIIWDGEKVGVIDNVGKIIIPYKYDAIQIGSAFSDLWEWQSTGEAYWTGIEMEETGYWCVKNKVGDLQGDVFILCLIKLPHQEALCHIYNTEGNQFFEVNIRKNGAIFYTENDYFEISQEHKFGKSGDCSQMYVQFFDLKSRRLTPFFTEAITIDSQYIMLVKKGKVGIKSTNNIWGWIMPPNFDIITLPLKGYIVGIKSNTDCNVCTLYHISGSLVEIASFDVDKELSFNKCLSSLRKLICASDLPSETKQWAENSNELVIFPLEEKKY